MPQQYGSAAREQSYDPSAQSNPFAPIDYAARLSQSVHAQAAQQPGSYQPGQVYGAPAPAYQLPQELANEYQPGMAQENTGVPYSSGLFERQPTGVMHASWEEGPFAAHNADWWQPEVQEQQPEQPGEPQEVYYSLDDIPLRDPFTPAQPKEHSGKAPASKKPAPKKKQRTSMKPGSLFALITACVLLLISGVAGGGLIKELVQTSRDAEAFRDEYKQENGVDVRFGAAKVELLPAGQTYVPTSTPEPTRVVVTPSPTPIIPVYGGAQGLDRREAPVQEEQPQATPTLPPRSRLTAYPDNPMCNIVESLREKIKENADIIGHLVIPGVVDEQVMQRNNTYYVTHNTIGATSEAGAVFADESCTLRLPPENLLLRGQGSVPGQIFAPLWQYVSGGKEFVAANQKARLTTLYEEANYQLFAVIVADSSPSSQQYFNYASNPTFTTDEAMLQYVELARQHSLYKFNVDVNASDRLLTLATLGDGRNSLVLIYRMQRAGE